MDQIATFWGDVAPRRRIVALLAAAGAALAVFGLAQMAAKPSMALLYAGLDGQAAGGVISALETRQVDYEVRGDAIFVPEDERDALRMALAAEGRPRGGAAGYELLDDLSGFGTTSQMFDAAYWRAKEGELARTVLALPNLQRARVHIANPVRRPFERGAAPTASVAVTAVSGTLTAAEAEAIRHLVSSAVAGLAPDDVAVIDAENGVALVDAASADAGSGGDDRAERLKANVERLLAARVGRDSVIVEVTVDADMNSETVRERVLDPNGRVAVHSDVQESTETAEGGPGGGVTVASNVPDGDANGGGGGGSRSGTESRERTNWEVSEVLRERVRRPGEIRRVSVAVLVDGVTSPGPDGGAPVWQPRSEPELEALRALVESAVGFDPARGDTITLRSLEFARAPELGVTAGDDGAGFFRTNAMRLLQTGVLALVALLLGLFVVKPLLAPSPTQLIEATAANDPAEALAGPESVESRLAEAVDAVETEGVAADRLAALRAVTEERGEDAAALLASWLEAGDASKERA